MSLDHYDFSTADAGAAHTFNMEAGQICVGGYICTNGKASKVTAMHISKTGKHGHAKCTFTSNDIFNGKKYDTMMPSTQTILVPNIKRYEYELVNITDDHFTTLMTLDGNIRENIMLPDFPSSFSKEIRTKFENTDKTWLITVFSAMGHDQIIAIKEDV